MVSKIRVLYKGLNRACGDSKRRLPTDTLRLPYRHSLYAASCNECLSERGLRANIRG
jgi:hypothetical protein